MISAPPRISRDYVGLGGIDPASSISLYVSSRTARNLASLSQSPGISPGLAAPHLAEPATGQSRQGAACLILRLANKNLVSGTAFREGDFGLALTHAARAQQLFLLPYRQTFERGPRP